MRDFKYLHVVAEGIFWLDHRVCPEVSGMLAAMSSRAPVGGVRARYAQIVEAVAGDLYESDRATRPNQGDFWPAWGDIKDKQPYQSWYVLAEDRLCTYPLHPKVQKFFDDFVGKYGHSSILELVGGVPVFCEGVSWLTAWLTFDSPLCSGQEFSTRAVQHADWPMARECSNYQYDPNYVHEGPAVHIEDGGISIHAEPGDKGFAYTCGNAEFRTLHRGWFEVFEAEVAWWKAEFTSSCPTCSGKGEVPVQDMQYSPHGTWDGKHEFCTPCQGTGKKYPTADKEPFRPALDRARWALPGTIATGCGHTSNLRERSRVLRDGMLLAKMSNCSSAIRVWEDLTQAYREALPGLQGMGLREAVYEPGQDVDLPGHLRTMFSDAPDGPDAEVECVFSGSLDDVEPFRRKGAKSYVDPAANAMFQVNITFRCSLAVSRDWHRHRTMYPWHLQVVRDHDGGDLTIDHHYAPMSDIAKEKLPGLLRRSTNTFDAEMKRGNIVQAALALPLGTRVRMRGQGGLRDAVYLLELRKFAHGANFEYQEQATSALSQLQAALAGTFALQDKTVVAMLGL